MGRIMGYTNLMKAADNGDFDLANKSIDRATIDKQTGYLSGGGARGSTALMIAAYKGHTDIVELLLNNGAQIETQNNDGDTALMRAVINNSIDAALVLLVHGANIEAEDKQGHTPLIVAAQNGLMDMANLLLGQRGQIKITKNDGSTVVIKAAQIEAQDKYGNTPLIVAAQNGNTEMATLLLEHGADKNTRDTKGWTALDWAEKEEKKELEDLLKKKIMKKKLKPRCLIRWSGMIQIQEFIKQQWKPSLR